MDESMWKGSLAEWLNARLAEAGRAPRWHAGWREDIAEVWATGLHVQRHLEGRAFTVNDGAISETGSELEVVVRALHEKLVGLKERTPTWEGRMIRPDALLRAFALEEVPCA